MNWSLLLEYLKVFLSWPVVVGMLAAFTLGKFSKELRQLVDRLGSVKFPGVELLTTQQQKLATEAPVVAAPAPKPNDIQGMHLTPEQVAQVDSVLNAERASATLWEFRYINYFFALGTHYVLDWLVALPGPITVASYHDYWTVRIPSLDEREAILRALHQHGMVSIQGTMLTVTTRAREYAQWQERRVLSLPRGVPAGPVPAGAEATEPGAK